MTNAVTISAAGLTGANSIIVVGTNLGGADTLTGGAGDDTIDGGAGNDTITAAPASTPSMAARQRHDHRRAPAPTS